QPSEAVEAFLDKKEEHSFLTMLVNGVIGSLNEIDEIIGNHLENWTLDRIAAVEKTILRIATYELNYVPEVPDRVAINEAVELAKKFGDEKSSKFVNGVLSKMINQ